MSKNRSHRRKQKQERRLVVRSIRRNPPDFKKLAGALIDLAMAQAEADAQAEDDRKKAARRRRAEHQEQPEESQGDDHPGDPA